MSQDDVVFVFQKVGAFSITTRIRVRQLSCFNSGEQETTKLNKNKEIDSGKAECVDKPVRPDEGGKQ